MKSCYRCAKGKVSPSGARGCVSAGLDAYRRIHGHRPLWHAYRRVYGGICLVAPGGKKVSRVVMTVVHFKKLNKTEIQNYIKTGEWHGKAGAYAIQGLASVFVKRINGSYPNVVGLPLYETQSLLTGLGYSKGKN